MERGNRLKEVRRSARLTALQLGDAVGVREATIFRYEAGIIRLSLAMRIALAKVLDSTLDELFPPIEEAS